jgi:hypothetical protein
MSCSAKQGSFAVAVTSTADNDHRARIIENVEIRFARHMQRVLCPVGIGTLGFVVHQFFVAF